MFKSRKPKRVGREDGGALATERDDDNGSVVRRPNLNAPKKKSKLRLSFNPSASETLETAEDIEISRPQSGIKTKLSHSLLQDPFDIASRLSEQDRPSYSKDHLQELRNSTPTTPHDLSTYNSSTEDAEEAALNVTGKFRQSHIDSHSIPSAAEIQEKKDRRARLAKEQGADDYIALEDYDSDGEFKPQRMQVGTYLQSDRDKDTRLVRDDEDVAEGFDDFVEDSGRVTLSKKGLRQQERKQREEMRIQIEDAENTSDEDDSDAELHQQYEAAQTSHGMEGLARDHKMQFQKSKQPSQLAPIPKLSNVLAQFRGHISELETRKAMLVKRKADIQKERIEISAREKHIQNLLTEAGAEFERLREEMRESRGIDINQTVNGAGSARGLESIGSTPGP